MAKKALWNQLDYTTNYTRGCNPSCLSRRAGVESHSNLLLAIKYSWDVLSSNRTKLAKNGCKIIIRKTRSAVSHYFYSNYVCKVSIFLGFVKRLRNSRIPNKIEKHRRSNNFCHKAKLSCLAVGIMGKTFLHLLSNHKKKLWVKQNSLNVLLECVI